MSFFTKGKVKPILGRREMLRWWRHASLESESPLVASGMEGCRNVAHNFMRSDGKAIVAEPEEGIGGGNVRDLDLGRISGEPSMGADCGEPYPAGPKVAVFP